MSEHETTEVDPDEVRALWSELESLRDEDVITRAHDLLAHRPEIGEALEQLRWTEFGTIVDEIVDASRTARWQDRADAVNQLRAFCVQEELGRQLRSGG